ncbi:MAG: hypothetical protein EB084_24285 [Proteobacteria bacterium]|nr:hypothetical protein [Pseudomonadota bacterium]
MIKNAEWKPFLDLLSPRFFDVVPLSTVLSQARTLGGNYFDTEAFDAARGARTETLTRAHLPVELATTLPGPASLVPGAQVLELYFHQVLLGGTVLLDLRAECFASRGERLVWAPRPAGLARLVLRFLRRRRCALLDGHAHAGARGGRGRAARPVRRGRPEPGALLAA